MCRSIKQLRGDESADDHEIYEAARQFVRKVSGYRTPSRANTEAFDRAIEEVSASTRKLLESLETRPTRAGK